MLCALAYQLVQFTGAIQRCQVFVPADVPLADEDLRNRSAPPASLHHDVPLLGVLVDLDFAYRKTFALEQVARALTIPAPRGRVHHYFDGLSHGLLLWGAFHDGQVLLKPSLQAAAKRNDLREAQFLEPAHRPCRGQAAVAVHEHRLLFEFLDTFRPISQLGGWDTARIDDMAGLVGCSVAYIQDERAGVHEPDGILRSDRRRSAPSGTKLDQDGKNGENRSCCDQEWVTCGVLDEPAHRVESCACRESEPANRRKRRKSITHGVLGT